MKKKQTKWLYGMLLLAEMTLIGLLLWLLWEYVPRASVRYGLLTVCGGQAFAVL